MRIRKRRNSKNAPTRNTLATQRDAAPEPVSENTASLADLQAQLQKPGTNFQNFAALPTYAPQQQAAPLQAKASGGKMQPAMKAIAQTSSSNGKPLPRPIQRKMEGAFGADFSDVRIHQGSQAKSIGAIAYTQGSDIHFQPGKYNPHNPNGQKLLGHELTHVLQQRAGRVSTPQAKGLPINRDSALETEADVLGAKAAQGETVQVAGTTSLQKNLSIQSATTPETKLTPTQLQPEKLHSSQPFSQEKNTSSVTKKIIQLKKPKSKKQNKSTGQQIEQDQSSSMTRDKLLGNLYSKKNNPQLGQRLPSHDRISKMSHEELQKLYYYIKKGVLTPNEKAYKNPERYLKEEASSTWTNVTSKAQKAETGDQLSGASEKLLWVPSGDDKGELKESGGGMNALLAFRLRATLRKDSDGGGSTLQNIAERVNTHTQQEYQDKGIKAQPNPLDWNYGAGGDSPTSDIDSNLSGDGTELAVDLFNTAFRETWGKESGVVFDVNVYARDYLPETGAFSLIKANKQNKIDVIKTKGDNRLNGKKHLSNEELESRGVKFETNLKEGSEAYKQDMATEEVFSLVKTCMDMGEKDWEAYKQVQLSAFEPNSIGFTTLNERLEAAEQKRQEREAAIEAKINSMVGNGKNETENRMAAENLMYAEKLQEVKNIRLELIKLKEDVKEGKASLNAIDHKSVALKAALYEASMFANEAYITGGTVKHVVANKQLLSTRSKAPTEHKAKSLNVDDIDRKLENFNQLPEDEQKKQKDILDKELADTYGKDISNLKLNISLDEYLHSFNEQLGFIFKELNLYGDNKNKALMKSAKYIYRMANAMKHIEAATKQSINDPIATQDFRNFARALFDLKVKGRDNSAVEQLNGMLAHSTIDEIKSTLFKLSASVQKIYRDWQEQPQPQQ